MRVFESLCVMALILPPAQSKTDRVVTLAFEAS